jgi:hypothetical protein
VPPGIFAAIAAASSAVGTAAASAGTALGLYAAGGLTLVGKIVLTAGLVGLSMLLTPRPPKPKPSDGSIEVKQAIPPRAMHYGRVKYSGSLGFYASRLDPNPPTWGVENNNSSTGWKLLFMSSREIDAFEQFRFDEEPVFLGASGEVTSPDRYKHNGLVRAFVYAHAGAADQAADANLMRVFPEWTAEHRLRGVAYAVLEFVAAGPEKFTKVFPNGEPNLTCIIRGSKIWDPRDVGQSFGDLTTWQWSDNAALCVLDYLTHSDGYAIDLAEIDVDSFKALADVCDELVPLKGGGTERRYRVSTTVYLTEPHTTVLQRLLEACAARLYVTAAAKWAIRGGRWVAPTIMLSAAREELIEAEFSQGQEKTSRYNEAAISFMSPDHGYVEVDGDPWQDAALIAANGGKLVTQPHDWTQVPSHSQARRLSKIRMALDNPDWIGTARTNFSGVNCAGEEAVDLVWSELDGEPDPFSGPFWIEENLELSEDMTGVAISLRSAKPASFDWNAEAEEGIKPTVPPLVDPLPEEPPAAPLPVESAAIAVDGVDALITWHSADDENFHHARVSRAPAFSGIGAAEDISGPIFGPKNTDMTFRVVGAAGSADDFFVVAESEDFLVSTSVIVTLRDPAQNVLGIGGGNIMGAGGGNTLGTGI